MYPPIRHRANYRDYSLMYPYDGVYAPDRLTFHTTKLSSSLPICNMPKPDVTVPI